MKDIGIVAVEGGWQVRAGGAAGGNVREADILATVESRAEALRVATTFLQYYRENADYKERTYDFIPRIGLDAEGEEHADHAAADREPDRVTGLQLPGLAAVRRHLQRGTEGIADLRVGEAQAGHAVVRAVVVAEQLSHRRVDADPALATVAGPHDRGAWRLRARRGAQRPALVVAHPGQVERAEVSLHRVPEERQ